MPQVQAAAAGAMGVLGLAAGAVGFYGVAPAQLLTVTSAFSVFMVCSAAGGANFAVIPDISANLLRVYKPAGRGLKGNARRNMHCSAADGG